MRMPNEMFSFFKFGCVLDLRLFFLVVLSPFGFLVLFQSHRCLDCWQMSPQKLSHTECTDPLASEDLGHLFVWEEVLLVFWVLEVMVLEVLPQHLDTLCSGGLFHSYDSCEIIAELHGLGQTRSFSSCCCHFVVLRDKLQNKKVQKSKVFDIPFNRTLTL